MEIIAGTSRFNFIVDDTISDNLVKVVYSGYEDKSNIMDIGRIKELIYSYNNDPGSNMHSGGRYCYCNSDTFYDIQFYWNNLK